MLVYDHVKNIYKNNNTNKYLFKISGRTYYSLGSDDALIFCVSARCYRKEW